MPANVFFEVDRRTSFQVAGYYFSKLYKKGIWDGRKHLLWKTSQLFPTGLAGYVCDALQKTKCPYEVVDCRTKPEFEPHPLNLRGIKLRGYQTEAVNIGVKVRRGIFKLGHGAGKTEIAAGLIQVLGLPSLVVTHRKELLYQTGTRIQTRTKLPVGYIGDGSWKPKEVTVAMIETLASCDKGALKAFLDPIDVLIIDEGHLLAAKVFYNIIQKCQAYFRFVFSGTPLMRDDNRNMMIIGATGPVVYEVGHARLVEEKVLAEPKVEFLKVETGPLKAAISYQTLDKKGKKKAGQLYKKVYEEGITNNKFRNSLILKKVQEHPQDQVLVLVRIIRHGKNLQELFTKAGVKSEFIWGDDEEEHRYVSLINFRVGTLKVLISSMILKEGVDIPAMDVLIVASGAKSKITTLQSLGRALRKAKGKTKALIIDFLDMDHPYLLRHSERRLEIYEKEKFTITLGS